MAESVPTEKNINKVKLYFQASIQYRTQEMCTRILEYKRKNVELASSSSVAIQGSTKTVYKDASTNNTREDLEDLSIQKYTKLTKLVLHLAYLMTVFLTDYQRINADAEYKERKITRVW